MTSAPQTVSVADIQAALPAYEIDREIGRGGCGVVLAGTHRKLGRRVAIKQIPPHFAGDVSVRRRFAAEARLMSAIDHPHVMPIYDYVEDGSLCALVGEFLSGGTVGERFARSGLDPASSIAVAVSCAAGLGAAHAVGVLHRDVKPANLIFAASGAVKLTDFGIAKIIGGGETLVTRAGDVLGTPAYIAPEQARGQELSPATDVYALATMVYELLSGTMPFPPADGMSLLFMHAFEEPTPLTEVAASVPGRVAEVVMTGLATDPADRFATAEEFGVALAGAAAGVWGGEWLSGSGVPLIGAETIMSAATGRLSSSVSVARGRERASAVGAAAAEATVRSRQVPSGGQAAAAPPATVVVRPIGARPDDGVGAADVRRDDVVAAREVVRFSSPRVPTIVAAALAAAAITAALVGVGAPSHGGDLPAGAATVAGVDPTSSAVSANLRDAVPVAVRAPGVDSVDLSTEVLGVRVAGHRAAVVAGGAPVEMAPPLPAWVFPQPMTARLALAAQSRPVGSTSFEFHTGWRSWLTATAAATLLVTLFALAYVESSIRTLRRGYGRVSAVIGLVASAIAADIAVCGWAWVLLGHEPTVPTLVVSAIIAAGAGGAAAVAAGRVGAIARIHRRRRRQRARRRVESGW